MICPFEPIPKIFIYASDLSHLLYYSHIPAMTIAIIFGLIVLLKIKSLIGKIFFGIMALFSVWVFFDLILWATNKSNVTMFFWSAQILLESLIFAAALYFVYVFINKQDASLKTKLIISGLLFPIVALLSTKFTLEGVDLTYCDAIESFIALYYIYAVEVIFSLWIILFFIKNYRNIQDSKTKKEILFLIIGIVLFLLAFSWGNLISSFTFDWSDDFTIYQYGLFGMPVFIAFLAYSIVKFKTFNIKLIGTNVLIVALWLLVVSLFFIADITTLRVVAGITLIFITILGYFLIKSVRQEVRQREELLVMTKMFQAANKQLDELNNFKSQFLSFASHQIKAPMAIIKGFAELLYSGSFGLLPDAAGDAVLKIKQSTKNLVDLVNDFLDSLGTSVPIIPCCKAWSFPYRLLVKILPV